MIVHWQLCILVLLVRNKMARVPIGWDNPVSGPFCLSHQSAVCCCYGCTAGCQWYKLRLRDLHSTDPKSFSYHFSSHNRENLEKLPDARHYLPSSHSLPQPFFLMRQNHFIYLHLSQSLRFRYRTFIHLCIQFSCETISKCSAKRAGSDQPLTFR